MTDDKKIKLTFEVVTPKNLWVDEKLKKEDTFNIIKMVIDEEGICGCLNSEDFILKKIEEL